MINEGVKENELYGKFVRAVLVLAFFIFAGLGAYAAYSYFNKEHSFDNLAKITPTPIVTENIQISQIPEPQLSTVPTVSISSSVTPTSKITPTLAPSPTIVPTKAITLTPTTTKYSTSTPTKTPEANLPVAGNGAPTLYLLTLGIILLLPTLLLT